MASEDREGLARLPDVASILERHDATEPVAAFGPRPFRRAVEEELERVRDRIRQGGPVPRADEIVSAASARLAAHRDRRLHRVVNATGVVLPGPLGRAPLSADARAAVSQAASYASLEYDLDDGGHAGRTDHLRELVAEACGTEDALVVNNGASALLLVAAAIAAGREVVVGRGDLVAVGETYRLPDVLETAGARLREVGATNRTRVGDYRHAVGDDTALLLKVHRSTYRVVGEVEETPPAALGGLGHEEGVPFVHDIGSGLLRAGSGALADEPSVEASVRAGADLVVFSADKLLGGPQAGIVAGRADLLVRCARHPLARALELDKLRCAALEATVEAHLRADVPTDVPVVAMLQADPALLHERAGWMAQQLGADAQPVAVRTVAGAGVLPGVELDSWAVAITARSPEHLEARLRQGRPPVICRIEDGRVLLDLRTVPPAQDGELVDLVLAATDR